MPFRLSAKKVFATWAQVGEYSLQDWKAELVAKLDQHGCPYKFVLGAERHQDGGRHFHAVVEYDSKRNFRSANFLDLFDKHGKYEPARNLQDCVKYCIKDGEICTNDEIWLESVKNGKKRRLGELVQATSTEQVLETFRQDAPRDYFLYYDKIKSNCDQIFKKQKTEPEPLFTLADFPNAHQDILDWAANELMGPHPKVCAHLKHYPQQCPPKPPKGGRQVF